MAGGRRRAASRGRAAGARQDIWSACSPVTPRPRELDAWRVVEGQHVVTTRRLVDDLEEQAILEELIDRVKPPPPPFAHLSYLLFTPFRHPPLRHGSRFGTIAERSLWYGSLDRQTGLAERAYYRLLFLDGTEAVLTVAVPETVFRAGIRAARFVDLTGPPFSAHEAAISSPVSYAASQPLGRKMREAGVEAFAFVSARAPARGTNVALFESVFSSSIPLELETWNLRATRDGAEFTHLTHRPIVFPRATFEVGGRLPSPGV